MHDHNEEKRREQNLFVLSGKSEAELALSILYYWSVGAYRHKASRGPSAIAGLLVGFWTDVVFYYYLTLDLNSSRVKDILGHTSTPAFSVDSELLHYFPGHADAFQILLYGVYPLLSWSSRHIFVWFPLHR